MIKRLFGCFPSTVAVVDAPIGTSCMPNVITLKDRVASIRSNYMNEIKGITDEILGILALRILSLNDANRSIEVIHPIPTHLSVMISEIESSIWQASEGYIITFTNDSADNIKTTFSLCMTVSK